MMMNFLACMTRCAAGVLVAAAAVLGTAPIAAAQTPVKVTLDSRFEGPDAPFLVALDKNYYQIADTRYPLRYGMTASAEIVVRERRLIDLGLDPFRQVAG